jgi:hypothetical protein
MNQRISELDREIAELNLRDEEIERDLHELAPARAKSDEPIRFEDYTGPVGEQKHRAWGKLMAERRRIRRRIRQRELQMYPVTRPEEVR